MKKVRSNGLSFDKSDGEVIVNDEKNENEVVKDEKHKNKTVINTNFKIQKEE